MKRFYEIQSTMGSYIQLMNIIGDNVFYIIPDTEHNDYITIIIRVEHVVDLHNLLIRLYGGVYEFLVYEEADALWHWDGRLPCDPEDFGKFIRGVIECKRS